MNVSIAIVDKQALWREGLKSILENDELFKVVIEVEKVTKNKELFNEIDVLIIEPDGDLEENHDVIKNILYLYPKLKIVILTNHIEETYVLRALQIGVHGYLLKTMSTYSIMKAIKIIVDGDPFIDSKIISLLLKDYQTLVNLKRKGILREEGVTLPLHLLTWRECEVLQLIADGKTNEDIADVLSISEKTVKNHMSSILKKMKVKHRTAAVVNAIKNGWVNIRI